MNDFKIEWDLAQTALELQVWGKLKGLFLELDAASDSWEQYAPEEIPDRLSADDLEKKSKSELIEAYLYLQETTLEEVSGIGTTIKESLETTVDKHRAGILNLRRVANDILNDLTFVKIFT